MAFTINNWTCTSSSLNQGQETVTPFGSSEIISNAPNVFMYGSPNDNTGTIGSANYFLSQYASLSVGDWIMGFGTDSPFIYQVTASSSSGVTVLNFANPTANFLWTNYTATFTGFSGTPTTRLASYLQIGKICFIQLNVSGTSNATTFTASLPITPAALSIAPTFALGASTNNSASQSNVSGEIISGQVLFFINGGSWSATGTKGVSTQFFYQTV